MLVIIPQNRGFCYGVSLAVNAANDMLGKGIKPFLFGEIVHNPAVNRDLIEKGCIIGDSIDDVKKHCPPMPLIIRAHGVSKEVYGALENISADIIDKTCPKVKKVQDIVKEASANGRKIVIVGNAMHPEVIGIAGQCDNGALIIKSEGEARMLGDDRKITVVSQTTFNTELFNKIAEVIKQKYSDAEIYNTVCPATATRQKEVEKLSENADKAVVIGGKKSSNSLKLYEIAEKKTKAYLIESPDEIGNIEFSVNDRVLLCSGSSTPLWHIEEASHILAKKYSPCEIKYL